MSDALYAPWRMDYIRSLSKPDAGPCFLCQARASVNEVERQSRLILWQTPHSVIVLNRYPYINGHILIAPLAHKADLEELNDDESLDLQKQTTKSVKLLKRAVSAQGFNVGINLGRCAGAGVPGHLHIHVVPRWAGDVNFMHVVGEVSVVPEALSKMFTTLHQVLRDDEFL